MRWLNVVSAALLCTQITACSVLDPDDRQQLRDRIGAMPPSSDSQFRRLVMNAKAIQWLRMKPENDQVGRMQCRIGAGGKWGDWQYQEEVLKVDRMLECLMHVQLDVTYEMCKDEWVAEMTVKRKNEIMEAQIPGADIECRYEWDFRYQPDHIPKNLIEPKSITVDDMIDVLLRLPAPPPGFLAPELAPLLCPLGAGPGWGCPDVPSTEGDPAPSGGD